MKKMSQVLKRSVQTVLAVRTINIPMVVEKICAVYLSLIFLCNLVSVFTYFTLCAVYLSLMYVLIRINLK